MMEREFDEIDRCGGWLSAYQDIKLLSKEFPFRMAKKPENSTRNRYRDVSPYDHSRVRLHRGDNDYINASLVPVADAGRRYILTQGPLPGTCGHFWQMVWEQESRAIIMLNRTVEKGSVKCAQYWPAGRDSDMCFMDTGFRVTLASEEQTASYTLRKLDLENTTLNEKKEILHFHYTAWPDFGVPESPAAFLCFLFRVCESGSLRARHGPAVVHCSAGIGRSGTFALVDSCLVLMELGLEGDDLDVRQVLLAMRKHRMGLIQTADQLRFSFLAIREGRKLILGLRPKENESIRGTDVGNKVRVDDVIEPSEPPPCPAKRLPDYPVCRMREQECHAVESNGGDEQLERKTLTTEGLVNVDDHECRGTTLRPSLSEAAALRRRARQQRVAATAERVAAMKRRQVEAERAAEAGWRGRWGPPLIRVSLIMAIAAGLFVGYRMFASNAEPKNFQ